VIVDEEHDSSFKASDGVRYSARDLAVKRAQLARCPIVLGSATPSLETWHLAQRKRYALLRLLQRGAPAGEDTTLADADTARACASAAALPADAAGSDPLRATSSGRAATDRAASDRAVSDRTVSDRTGSDRTGSDRTGSDRTGSDRTDGGRAAMPRIIPIDLKVYPAQQGLSAPLQQAIASAIGAGSQALVFINRRGYAPVLACEACGWLSDCPNCSAHSALHRGEADGAANLHCHHCGWSRRVPRACPVCGNQDLKPVGQGTQRVEETLRAAWPAARICRIDRDSARRAGGIERTLSRVHTGEVDVLVGTQMIAKGHDFRRVSVVGVLNVDAQLVAPDFRAPERLFALLMQVAGRAGRAGQPAQVLLQTRYPDHALFRALASGDYGRFAQLQLAERRAARMPPFAFQALLSASAPELQDATGFLGECRRAGVELMSVLQSNETVTLYDVVPMPMARVAAQMRAQLLIESSSRRPLHELLGALVARLRAMKTARGLRWQIEVDPLAI